MAGSAGDAVASFVTARGVLDAAQCADLRARAELGAEARMVPAAGDRVTRRAGTATFFAGDEGLVARLRAVLDASPFDVDLDGLEPLQLARYGVGDEYGWHIDLGPGAASRRKLSVTVLLSDAAEFDGGRFELGAHAGVEAPMQRGDAVVFPSYLRHRVTPVTRGVRVALVGWFTGPPFR